MQQIEVTRRIAGPPQAVWDVYTDHLGWADWGGMIGARIERPGLAEPNGVGCVRVFGPGPLAAAEEILSFDAPRRMTYKIISGGIPIRDHFGEVDFESVDGGSATRVVWRCRFESKVPGLGGFFRFMVTRLFHRVLDGMAERRFPEVAQRARSGREPA